MTKPSRLVAYAMMVTSLLLLVFSTFPPSKREPGKRPVSFLRADPSWAEAQLRDMGTAEKLGQLLWLQVDPVGLSSPDTLRDWVARGDLGALLWRGYDRAALDSLLPRLQQQSRRPLLMGLQPDTAQAGLITLPAGLALGALHQQPQRIQAVAPRLAQQARSLGLHLVMLPSLARAYDSPPVADQLMRSLKPLQNALEARQVLTCLGPVFPYVSPLDRDTLALRQRLHPYRWWTQQGLAAWQLAPTPSAERPGYPEPVSALTYGKLDYQGLTLAEVPVGGRDLRGAMRRLLRDGAEVFTLRPAQVPEARVALAELLRTGALSEAELDRRVRRVLLAKTWTGASSPADTLPPPALRRAEADWQQQQLRLGSMTLLRNPDGAVPLGALGGRAVHVLSLRGELPALVQQLRAYGPVSVSRHRRREGRWPALPVQRLRRFDPIILVAPDTLPHPVQDAAFWQSLAELQGLRPVIAVHPGDLATLGQWPEDLPLIQTYGLEHSSQPWLAQLLMGGLPAEGNLPLALEPQLPFGQGLRTSRQRLAYLPPEADGLDSERLARIDTVVWGAIRDGAMPGCQVLVAHRGKVIVNQAYGHHTYAKRRPVYLTDLYDIASMTKVAATTVAAMHLVDRGKMKLDDPLRTFFRDTYAWVDTSIRRDTVYFFPPQEPDSLLLAQDSLVPDSLVPTLPVLRVAQGISRGAGPSPTRTDTIGLGGDSLMVVRTFSSGQRTRLPSRVMNLTLAELLTHHSGLSAAVPVYRFLTYRRYGGGRFGRYFQPRQDSNYQIAVARQFYLRRDFRDSIWEATKAMPVDTGKAYQYSDANMFLVQQAIDSLNQMSLHDYLSAELYEPLGMQQTGYLPLDWTEAERIVPTESDQAWRYQLLRGYVHDETAALLGGVSGNAGLFANANDLGHLFQMLLNGGSYGGHRYLQPRTVEAFTRRRAGHRGYGFDLPPLNREYYLSRYASPRSWGHTGFTGTCVWVDPEEELVYIFLSNRIHPRDNNGLINELAVRQRVHDVVYEAIRAARK